MKRSANRIHSRGGTIKDRFVLPGIVTACFVLGSAGLNSVMAGESCEPHWDNAIGQPGMENGPALGVFALELYDNELIAAGSFADAGGETVNKVARWDGSSWQSLGDGLGASTVRALTVYDGDLIAGFGGSFTDGNGVQFNKVARWDGTEWQPLGDMVSGGGWIEVLTEYNGDLIAAGAFTEIGGISAMNVARWDGSNWHPLGDGVQLEDPDHKFGYDGEVNGIAVYDGELIVMGWFTLAGGQPASGSARWDGSDWSPFCCGGQAMTLYDGQLAYGTTSVLLWDGSSTDVIGQVNGIGTVLTLSEHNGDLIAGGSFTSIGGVSANRIARWDGSEWHPLAGGLDSSPLALATFDGQLVVGGWFSAADGEPASRIAAWVTPEPVTPADLNCDSVVDVDDLFILLAAWGECANPDDCPADLNGDNVVDVDDLFILLAEWG